MYILPRNLNIETVENHSGHFANSNIIEGLFKQSPGLGIFRVYRRVNQIGTTFINIV